MERKIDNGIQKYEIHGHGIVIVSDYTDIVLTWSMVIDYADSVPA